MKKVANWLVSILAVGCLLGGSVAAKGDESGETAPTKKTDKKIEDQKTQTIAVTAAKATDNDFRKGSTTTDAKTLPDARTLQDQIDKLQPSTTNASPATGEQINWQVISSGGGFGTSINFQLAGVMGQTAVGEGSSTNFGLNSGFLQDFGPGSCCIGTVGNADGDPDELVDVRDLVTMINALFITFEEFVCPEEANTDGDIDGLVDVRDLVALINSLFITFDPLPECP